MRAHPVQLGLWAVVFVAVAISAYRHRDTLEMSWRLMQHARLRWLGLAALAIGGVYACRAVVYRIPLRSLGFTVPVSFLWRTALIATTLHQLLPAGGATGYAFLTYALHQRGVPAGPASLIALFDTLSYATAMATLVVASLAYVGVTPGATGAVGAWVLVPRPTPLALASWLYWLQRKPRRFMRVVLRMKSALARLLHARWRNAPIRAFLRQYYRGKLELAGKRRAFALMVALQYVAVACDAGALYMT